MNTPSAKKIILQLLVFCYYEIDGLVPDNEYAQLPPLQASERDELLYVISSEEWERDCFYVIHNWGKDF